MSYNKVPVSEKVISSVVDLPAVVSGFHVWESGTYRIDGPISSQYGHKRADGAQVYIHGQNLQNDTITFTGGADGTFTSASDPGGGKTQINLSDTTGFVNGDIIFLPKTTVYDKEARYTISNLVANTSFQIDTAFIATDSGTFYKGQMFIDDETVTGQENSLLRLENVGLFISGGGRLFDFQNGGNTRGTIWISGGFIVGDSLNYCELGIVDNSNFFTMSSINIYTNWDDGICLNNIDQIVINSQMTNWKNNDGDFVCTGSGTFNKFTVSGGGCIFEPDLTESAFYLDPAATYSQVVVFSGIVNTGTFFRSGSLDHTSTYVKTSNVSGVPDSSVSAQIKLGANTLDTLIPLAGAYVLVRSDAWEASELERITTDVTPTVSGGVSEYTGLDDIRLKVNISFSIDPATAGTKSLGIRLLKISAAQRVITFTNATNIVNEVATPRANGDTIIFYDTAGTLPTGLLINVVYFVINKTTDSFQLSYTDGGAAVLFTDDGTPTNSYKIATLNGVPSTASVSSGSPKSLTRFGALSVSTGDKFAGVFWNADDAVDITAYSGGIMT